MTRNHLNEKNYELKIISIKITLFAFYNFD